MRERPIAAGIQAEHHWTQHIGWLNATVLGANACIVSSARLILGLAAASTAQSAVLVACVAGLAVGAMSMMASEYP
jgi:VIT1/CCC1 family predicted Fe2+/Mn2+ transporter